MSVVLDYTLPALEDGTLVIPISPPTNISGWTLQYTQYKRPQTVSGFTSGEITKSCASGFNNVSGIQVTDGSQGRFNVNLFRTDVSGGLETGCHYYRIDRLDSGNASLICEGFRLIP